MIDTVYQLRHTPAYTYVCMYYCIHLHLSDLKITVICNAPVRARDNSLNRERERERRGGREVKRVTPPPQPREGCCATGGKSVRSEIYRASLALSVCSSHLSGKRGREIEQTGRQMKEKEKKRKQIRKEKRERQMERKFKNRDAGRPTD